MMSAGSQPPIERHQQGSTPTIAVEPGSERRLVRIAIWGTFDLANFGDLLFPRIFVHEMTRRLPRADVRVFSPLGYEHPVPLDGGFVAEPLGEWSRERVGELAEELDLIAIGGGEIIHTGDELYARYYDIAPEDARRLAPSAFFLDGLGPDAERRCPVAWHAVGVPFDIVGEDAARIRTALASRAYVSVRDELSRQRLVRAGVEREIAVVPDSGFLAERVLPRPLLEKRLRYLRAIGSYPVSEPPVVVQGSVLLVERAEEIGSALRAALEERPAPVVLLETGPCHGDGEFADALARHLTGPVFRMHGGVGLEDIASAIVHARAFVGISMHAAVIAFAYGVPAATLNLVGFSKLDSLSQLLESERTLVRRGEDLPRAIKRVLDGERPGANLRSLVPRIDAHFDRLAELAERAAAARRGGDWWQQNAAALAEADARYERLRRAYEARGQRRVLERLRFAELLERVETGTSRRETEARLLAHMEELGRLRRELEARTRPRGLKKLLRRITPLRRLHASLRRSRP